MFLLGNTIAETVHLPKVPGNDVGKISQQCNSGCSAKMFFIVVNERIKQVFTCQKQIVTLPLVAIGCLECQSHLTKPFLITQLLFVHQRMFLSVVWSRSS